MELDVELISGHQPSSGEKTQHFTSPHCPSDVIGSIPSIELKLFGDGAVCGQVEETPTQSTCKSGRDMNGELGNLLVAPDDCSVVHQLDDSLEVEEGEFGNSTTTTTMWGCHQCGLAMSGTEQQLHDHVRQCGLGQTAIHHGGDDDGAGGELTHHLVTTTRAFDEGAHRGSLSVDHFANTMLIAEDDCDDAGVPQQPGVLCVEDDAADGHEVHHEDEAAGTKKDFVTSSDVRLVARYWKCSVCGVAMQQGLAAHLGGHSKDELIGVLLALAEPVYHDADQVFLATTTTQAEADGPKSPTDDHSDVIPIFDSSSNTLTEFTTEQNSVNMTACMETSTHQHIVTISPPRSSKVSSEVWNKRTRHLEKKVNSNENYMHRELCLRGVQVVKEIRNHRNNTDDSSMNINISSPRKLAQKKFSIVTHNNSGVGPLVGVQRQHQVGDNGVLGSTGSTPVGVSPPASIGRGRRRGALNRVPAVQRQWSSRAPHPCPVCGKVLSSRGNVAKHITTHSASKPWNCTSCGVGFNSQRDKHHHDQQYHSGGERTHECPVCGKAFAVRDNLREHLLFHDRKAKACDICGKLFWTQKCVTRHRKRHFPDKKHRCELCPKTFAVKWDCTLHARKVHGVS